MWRANMKDLKEYLALPFPIEIIPDEGGYIAAIPDLPGCMSSGKTVNAALRGLEKVKELWLQGRIEAGQEIPEPTKIEDFSGKFVLRIPRALHRTLDHEARKQGVSLNQYLVHVLSERHHLGALQDKIELALERLPGERECIVSGWRGTERYGHVQIIVGTTPLGPATTRLPSVPPRPCKSYRVAQRPPNWREFAHAHR
jgi:predicted RNase H-like HicB family nuclease